MHENAAKSELGIVAICVDVMGGKFSQRSEEQRGQDPGSALTVCVILGELFRKQPRNLTDQPGALSADISHPSPGHPNWALLCTRLGSHPELASAAECSLTHRSRPRGSHRSHGSCTLSAVCRAARCLPPAWRGSPNLKAVKCSVPGNLQGSELEHSNILTRISRRDCEK